MTSSSTGGAEIVRSLPQSSAFLSSHDVEPTGTNTEELPPCGYCKGEQAIYEHGRGRGPRPRGGLRDGNSYPNEPYYVPEKDRICDYPVKVSNLDWGVKREKFADYAARMVKHGGQAGRLPLGNKG